MNITLYEVGDGGAPMAESWDREPQIGYWTCICCAIDLERIEDDAAIQSILFARRLNGQRVWETKSAALKELALEDGCE